MRANFQPYIHAEVARRTDRRRRTARAALFRVPNERRHTLRRNAVRPVTVLKNGTLSSLGARSASAVSNASEAGCIKGWWKRVIHTHEPSENALLLQFGGDRLQRHARPGKGQRAGTVESCNGHGAAVGRV